MERITANLHTQLTLLELVSQIKVAGTIKYDGTPKDICFDFGGAVPTSMHSWRGIYSEVEIGFTIPEANHDIMCENASAFLDMISEAIGSTFEGWKGGEYMMNKDTPVWVSNPR